MTQNKKTSAKTSVRLLCILSGDGQSWSAGQTIEVDHAEAERLISIGAAEAIAKK